MDSHIQFIYHSVHRDSTYSNFCVIRVCPMLDYMYQLLLMR